MNVDNRELVSPELLKILEKTNQAGDFTPVPPDLSAAAAAYLGDKDRVIVRPNNRAGRKLSAWAEKQRQAKRGKKRARRHAK